jgi:hypothetical protein
MQLLTDQLTAGIDDEEVQFRVLAEIEADLAEMRIGRTLLLQDDPDHVGAVGERHVAYRGNEARLGIRRQMALDHGRFRAGTEGNAESAYAPDHDSEPPGFRSELRSQRRRRR